MNTELDEDDNISGNSAYSNVIYLKEVDWVNNGCVDEEIEMVEAQSHKRIRESEEDESDEFTTVSRKGKRLNRLTSEEAQFTDGNKINNLDPVVVMTHQEMPRQLGLAKILAELKIEGISRIKFKNKMKVEIYFGTNGDAMRTINNVELRKRGFTVRYRDELPWTFGVIRDIEIALSVDEIRDILESEVQITEIKRLEKRHGTEWQPSESLRLRFQGPTLPPYVSAYGLRCRVEPYIFPVTQCFMCWKFGHVAKACPKTTIKLCPKCGGKHENCETKTPTCTNCKGDHMSMDKSCPAYEKEKILRNMMGIQSCTYKMAHSTYTESRQQNNIKVNNMARSPTISQDKPNEVTPHKEQNLEPSTSETSKKEAPITKQSYANAVRGNKTGKQTAGQTRNEYSPSQIKNTATSNNNSTATSNNNSTEYTKEGNPETLEPGRVIKSLLELFRTWRQGGDWKTSIKKLLVVIVDWVKQFLTDFMSDFAFSTLWQLHG